MDFQGEIWYHPQVIMWGMSGTIDRAGKKVCWDMEAGGTGMETVAKITIRCFVLGMVLLLIWFLMYALAGELMYEIHSKWFDLTEHEFAVIHYSGMARLKVFCFLFFLFPYISCRLCGKK